MTAPSGFEEYAAARWPDLVRTVRLLGAPEAVAVEVALESLSRLRGRWRRIASSGDPDPELRDLLVETWDAHRRRPWWDRHPADRVPAGLDDLMHLDALGPRERSDSVLQAFDRSSSQPDDRWASALHLPVASAVPGRADLATAAGRRRARWARRAIAPALALALVLVVGAAATLLGRGGDPDARGAPLADQLPRALSTVAVGDGPGAWVTWYADGRLHLGTTAVAVTSVRAVVDVLGAAVYVDRAGEVVRVAPNGRRVLLGRTDDPSSLVASDEGDLVGWVEVTRGTHPELVVADAADGARRATYVLGERGATRPAGLREDRMYVVDGDRTRVWRFADGAMDDLGGPTDAADPDRSDLVGLQQVVGQLAVFGPGATSRSRLAFLDPKDETTPESTWVGLPGDQVRVARDGEVVAARSGAGQVSLVVQGTGGFLPSGLGDDDVAVEVSVGPDRRVAYLVARAEDRFENRPTSGELAGASFDGPLTLRTCTVSLSPRATECTRVVDLAGSDEVPVLAR